MLSFNSFVILDEDDQANFDDLINLAWRINLIDFAINSYPVDVKRYLKVGKALLKGKGKAPSVEDEEEDEEESGDLGGTPSLSTRHRGSETLVDDTTAHQYGSFGHDADEELTPQNQGVKYDNPNFSLGKKPFLTHLDLGGFTRENFRNNVR